MAKGIIANSAFNAAAGMMMLVTGFISAIIAARLLGPAANGTIAFAFWLSTSGALVAGLGADTMLPRFLSKLRAEGLDENRRAGFTAYFSRAVLLAVVILLLLYFGLVFESEKQHWAATQPSVIILTGVLFVVQALGILSIYYLIGEQRLEGFFKLTLLSSSLQLVSVFIGAWYFGVAGALCGYVVGQGIFFLNTLRLIARKGDACGLQPGYLAKTSMIISVQIIIEAIFLSRLELLFLERYLNVESVGFYAIGLSLANLALQLPIQATGSLVPFYTEQLHARGSSHLPAALFGGLMRILAYITLPMSFGLAAISSPLVTSIYGEGFKESGSVVALLSLSAPIAVFISVGTKYMFAVGHERQRTIIGAVGALCMVIGCLILVPGFGGEGAAVARILVSLVISVLMVRHMKFEGSLLPTFVSLGKIAIAALACAIAAFLLSNHFGGFVGLGIAIFAAALIYVVVLRILKAVPQEDMVVVDRVVDRLPRPVSHHAKRIFQLIAA